APRGDRLSVPGISQGLSPDPYRNRIIVHGSSSPTDPWHAETMEILDTALLAIERLSPSSLAWAWFQDSSGCSIGCSTMITRRQKKPRSGLKSELCTRSS